MGVVLMAARSIAQCCTGDFDKVSRQNRRSGSFAALSQKLEWWRVNQNVAKPEPIFRVGKTPFEPLKQ